MIGLVFIVMCLFYWFLVCALGGANAESWKVEGSAGGIVTDKAGN
jgi:hypothetical protein